MSKKISVYDSVFEKKKDKLIKRVKELRKCCPKQAKELIKRLIKEAKDIKKELN